MSVDNEQRIRKVDEAAWKRLTEIAESLGKDSSLELDHAGVDHLVKLIAVRQ